MIYLVLIIQHLLNNLDFPKVIYNRLILLFCYIVFLKYVFIILGNFKYTEKFKEYYNEYSHIPLVD